MIPVIFTTPFRLSLLACALSLPACTEWFQMAPRQEFNVRGVIRGIASDGRSITIQHEKINGYSPEATKNFAVKKRRDLAGLRPGQGVSFRLVVTEKESAVDRFHTISAEQVWVTRVTPTPSGITLQQAAPGLPQPP